MDIKQQTLYLFRCGIKQIVPDTDLIREFDLEGVFLFAKKHMISAIIAYALELAGISNEKFVITKAKAIRNAVLYDNESEAIFHVLDEKKIWYMPLKGMVIKELYPVYGLREMADYDILFDEDKSYELRKIMEGLGFTCVSFGKRAHDIYHKEPIFNFEMHRMLFGSSDEMAESYYNNIFNRLIKSENGKYRYEFSLNDGYVYLIKHAYKHYMKAGTGFRLISDVFLYLQKYKEQMNMNYVDTECQKLGVDDFERQIRSLAINFFNKENLSKEDDIILDYICDSGAFGSSEHRVNNEKKGKGKISGIKYLLGRIFIPLNVVKEVYPIIYQFRLLIVFLPIIRIFEALTVYREKARKEIKYAFDDKGEL